MSNPVTRLKSAKCVHLSSQDKILIDSNILFLNKKGILLSNLLLIKLE